MTENNIVVFEDANLAKLVADEICGNPNNLDCLTVENLAKITELFSITMLIQHLEEEKIHSLKGLEYCINLQQLHLVDHHITDLSPLYNLKYLRVLNLRTNNIESIYPLADKKSIETLVIGQNQIKDLSIVKTLIGLKELYVQENPLKQTNLLFLNDLSCLEVLCFWGTNHDYINTLNQFREGIELIYDKQTSLAS